MDIKNSSNNSNLEVKEAKEELNAKNKKKTLGQFYTTNYEYILQGMIIPKNTQTIIEPFAGNGDLVKFAKSQLPNALYECYDIDPKHKYITKKDTLRHPPAYKDKYLITNPPYLARNKCRDKSLFNRYKTNDLYKCLITEILINRCSGGILIVPLNFWSSIRLSDIVLRRVFFEVYNVIKVNIFEEQVFDDTAYAVCSFQFENIADNPKTVNDAEKADNAETVDIMVYPHKIKINDTLNYNNNYMIGGEIYTLVVDKLYDISRLTKKNKHNAKYITNILVKCIDDNQNNQIGLKMVSENERYIDTTPNLSARTYATLVISPEIDHIKQTQLVEKFNKFLNDYRKKYHSLFLPNYRENKDIARKRISFDLVYKIVSHILENFDDL